MTFGDVITGIQAVGLPTVLVAVLGFLVYKMGDKMLQQQEKSIMEIQKWCKERESSLMTEIEENRKINAKAIDTIGAYAAKLDIIQNDINDIKHNVTAIMTREGKA